MLASSIYYSAFISCILFTYPTISISVNNSALLIPNKSKISKVESSSINPSSKTNITSTALNSSMLSSSKQTNEETTRKYDTMKKMNLIKPDSVNKIIPTTSSSSLISTYRLKNADDGSTCILMTVDAMISFLFVTNLNQIEESDVFVPDERKIEVTGDCSSGERSSLLLKWLSFSLSFDFVKTPGGERWFVSGIQLNFNTKDSKMNHPNHPNTLVQASTNGDLLFPTPVGRSFKCLRENPISLSDEQFPDINITLLLRQLTIQPFIFKNDDFGPEYLCSATGSGSFRSETAPFIFGTLLTFASFCTIGAYAGYHYLKVNKVQYDAME